MLLVTFVVAAVTKHLTNLGYTLELKKEPVTVQIFTDLAIFFTPESQLLLGKNRGKD